MIPRHIAIIMDGNGRWAGGRGLPRVTGHRAGMETLHKIVRHAGKRNIEWLTLYAFSSENWLRPAEEVRGLLALLKVFIFRDLESLRRDNVRIKIIGSRNDLSAEICALLDKAEEQTQKNTGLNLVVAFNYGSRDEIVRAARLLAEKAAAGRLPADTITEEYFAASMDTADMPDPDLIIRTGGDIRLSNFLLWQAAYAELSFTPRFWPDFTTEDFDEALAIYRKRERRFGRLCSRQAMAHIAKNDDEAERALVAVREKIGG